MAWVDRNIYWLIALLLLVSPAWADSEEPSLELLEFLAEWQDEEGSWVDPVEFAGNEEGLFEDEQSEEGRHE